MIVCVDASTEVKINETINPVALTLNKFYKVLNDPEKNKTFVKGIGYVFYLTVRIINDDGLKATYKVERFLTLQEWRQKQLQRLLDNAQV